MGDFFEMQFSCGSCLHFYLKTMQFEREINAILFGIALTEQLSIFEELLRFSLRGPNPEHSPLAVSCLIKSKNLVTAIVTCRHRPGYQN